MSNIRRYQIPGSIVFITAVCYQREPFLKPQSSKRLLLEVLNDVKQVQPFQMLAYVILDDHFHWMIKPSEGESFSKIMQSVKLKFTNRYKKLHTQNNKVSTWQKRFWDHVIRDEEDLKRHLDYIHYNPIKHGLVNTLNQYPYSSFLHHVGRGRYDLYWGTSTTPEYLQTMDLE